MPPVLGRRRSANRQRDGGPTEGTHPHSSKILIDFGLRGSLDLRSGRETHKFGDARNDGYLLIVGRLQSHVDCSTLAEFDQMTGLLLIATPALSLYLIPLLIGFGQSIITNLSNVLHILAVMLRSFGNTLPLQSLEFVSQLGVCQIESLLLPLLDALDHGTMLRMTWYGMMQHFEFSIQLHVAIIEDSARVSQDFQDAACRS